MQPTRTGSPRGTGMREEQASGWHGSGVPAMPPLGQSARPQRKREGGVLRPCRIRELSQQPRWIFLNDSTVCLKAGASWQYQRAAPTASRGTPWGEWRLQPASESRPSSPSSSGARSSSTALLALPTESQVVSLPCWVPAKRTPRRLNTVLVKSVGKRVRAARRSVTAPSQGLATRRRSVHPGLSHAGGDHRHAFFIHPQGPADPRNQAGRTCFLLLFSSYLFIKVPLFHRISLNSELSRFLVVIHLLY